MRAAGKHLVGDARVLQRAHSADVRNQFSAVDSSEPRIIGKD
jgi:hypothetical protein